MAPNPSGERSALSRIQGWLIQQLRDRSLKMSIDFGDLYNANNGFAIHVHGPEEDDTNVHQEYVVNLNGVLNRCNHIRLRIYTSTLTDGKSIDFGMRLNGAVMSVQTSLNDDTKAIFKQTIQDLYWFGADGKFQTREEVAADNKYISWQLNQDLVEGEEADVIVLIFGGEYVGQDLTID